MIFVFLSTNTRGRPFCVPTRGDIFIFVHSGTQKDCPRPLKKSVGPQSAIPIDPKAAENLIFSKSLVCDADSEWVAAVENKVFSKPVVCDAESE